MADTTEGRNAILARAAREKAKRSARASREAAASPDAKHEAGSAVEIVGPAKVDASDAIGIERSDHQGAVALVEGHYDDPRRGKMAQVRTEDNKVRVIPESRLRGLDAPKPQKKSTQFGPLGISQARFDAIFKKSKRKKK